MAPFASMLKSKRSRRRPVTPPSPGSFVSPHSPTWHLSRSGSFEQQQQHYDDTEYTRPQSPEELRAGVTAAGFIVGSSQNASQSQSRPNATSPPIRLDLTRPPSSHAASEARSYATTTSSGFRLGRPYDSSSDAAGPSSAPSASRPILTRLDLPSSVAPHQARPSLPSRSASSNGLQSTLSVVHSPERDSMLSSEGSESQHQLMSFAFPLPPTTPVDAPSGRVGQATEPNPATTLPAFNVNGHMSLEDLLPSWMSSGAPYEPMKQETEQSDLRRLPLPRSRSATLPLNDIRGVPSPSSSGRSTPTRKEPPKPIRIPPTRASTSTTLASVPEIEHGKSGDDRSTYKSLESASRGRSSSAVSDPGSSKGKDLHSKPQPPLPPPTPGSARFTTTVFQHSPPILELPEIAKALTPSRPPRNIPDNLRSATSSNAPSAQIISGMISSTLARQSAASTFVPVVTAPPTPSPQPYAFSMQPSPAFLTPSGATDPSSLRASDLPFTPGFLLPHTSMNSMFSAKPNSGQSEPREDWSRVRVDSATLPLEFEPMQIAAMLAELGKSESQREGLREDDERSNIAVKSIDPDRSQMPSSPSIAAASLLSSPSASPMRHSSAHGVKSSAFSRPVLQSSASSPSLLNLAIMQDSGQHMNYPSGESSSRASPAPLDHFTSAKLAARKRLSISAEQATFFPRMEGDENPSPLTGDTVVDGEKQRGPSRSSSKRTGPTVVIPQALLQMSFSQPTSPQLVHSPSTASSATSRSKHLMTPSSSSSHFSTPLDPTDALILALALHGASTSGLGEVEEEAGEETFRRDSRRQSRQHAYATAMPVQAPSSSTASERIVFPEPLSVPSEVKVIGGGGSSSELGDSALMMMDGPDGVVITKVARKRQSFSKPPRPAPVPGAGPASRSNSVSSPAAMARELPVLNVTRSATSSSDTRPGTASSSASLPAFQRFKHHLRDRSASDAGLLSSTAAARFQRSRSESESASSVPASSSPTAVAYPSTAFLGAYMTSTHDGGMGRKRSGSDFRRDKGKEVDREQQEEVAEPPRSKEKEKEKTSSDRRRLHPTPAAVLITPALTGPGDGDVGRGMISPSQFPATPRPFSITSSSDHNHQLTRVPTIKAPEGAVPPLPVLHEGCSPKSTQGAGPGQASSLSAPPSQRTAAVSFNSTTRKGRLSGGREGGLRFTGSPTDRSHKMTAPVSLPSFERVSIPWKGLTIDAAKWTLSSQELQAIVSRAIRQSAEASTTRLLSPEVLDNQIPPEVERLEALQTDIKARYKFQIRRRKLLMRSLGLHLEGSDVEKKVKKLMDELSGSSDACDQLSQELFQVSDQLAQMNQLMQKHNSSALSMGLRKLNASYVKAKGESMELQTRLAVLEAERDEGWALAEALEGELLDKGKAPAPMPDGTTSNHQLLQTPQLGQSPPSGPVSVSVSMSSGSSRVSVARSNSARASKASFRMSFKRSYRSSSASGSNRFSNAATVGAPPSSRDSIIISRPTSLNSTMTYQIAVPPVPPLPRERTISHSTVGRGRHMSMTIASTPTTATSQSHARALVQVQNQLYEMLGIPSPTAQMGSFGHGLDMESATSSSPTRPRSFSFPSSPPPSGGLPWTTSSQSQSRRMSDLSPLFNHGLLESPQVIAAMLSSLPSGPS